MNAISCQPLLDRLTFALVKTGVIGELSKRKTEKEKIKFCLGIEVTYKDVKINVREEIQNLLNALYDKCEDYSKSETLALKTKNQGSKAFLKKNDKEALHYFSESIRLSPPHSSVLSLSYANRSAVLFHMQKYKAALQDMVWAEKSNYPATLKHKLLIRRCRCYVMIGKVEEAREVLEACITHIDSVPQEAKEKYEKEVEDLKQKIDTYSHTSNETNLEGNLQHPTLYDSENDTVKYMTSAFELRESDRLGRHIVAVKEVGKGCEVFVEKPYAAILLPEHHTTHCHTCFSKTTNPYPCTRCRDTIFCNEECMEAGSSWHQYECGILHILSSVGIAHLALRIMLITTWKLHCRVRDEVSTGKITGVGEKGCYNGPETIDKYRAVYQLLPHFNNCLLEDQLQYCLAAILLATAISDRTSFLEDNASEGNGDETEINVLLLASGVMRHIAQLVSNAHAITQLVPSNFGDNSRVEQIKQIRVASAIYPTASMMNHSCKPNIINSFYNDVLVIRTIADIKPGDQVNNCYGPHYCRQTREERQESLKQQYFFTCKCEPCTQPQYMKREASWSGFFCESCGGVSSWMGSDDGAKGGVCGGGGGGIEEGEGVLVCLECHKLQRPSSRLVSVCSKVTSLYESSEEAIKYGNLMDAISLLRNAIQLASKVYLPENQYYLRIRDSLALALADSGNYEKCSEELRECVQFLEKRYGSESIELAHEYLKYSEVLELASADDQKYQSELSTVRKKIDDIFSLNYGPQWKAYLGAGGKLK